ncbi:Cell pattern formation-associated protein, partial [Hortaea werneckii]
VSARGNDSQWTHAPFVPYSTDVPPQTSVSSVGSSPRAGSFSGSSIANHSHESNTSYASSIDGSKSHILQTPSPEQVNYHSATASAPAQFQHNQSPLHPLTSAQYGGMNPPQPYMDVSQSHPPPSGPAPSMGQYSGYGQPQTLQPATHGYSGYGGYSYPSTMPPMSAGHPVTSSMGGQMMPQTQLPLPTMAGAGQPAPGSGQQFERAFDTTGQIAPPGMKPRVTATLWEDEGSLCFQVEANGVCVARREDNHMINGTKLLNVAGMTRGRRDGILKSEKTRHVVKIGPMHLKGVWIPFDRALDFANREKITELLYPLFVHNIGALLYHPTNQARQSIGNAAMAARRPEQPEYMRTPGSQPPTLTHHHSMSNPVGANMPQPPHAIAPHPASGRPGLDRAHTFPTPPTSASSLTMGMGNAGSSYEYGGGHAGAMNSGQPISADTGMAARTVPTSPAATPPGSSQAMQYQTTQPYDSARSMYSQPASYGQYAQPGMGRYGGVNSSPTAVKHEMGPPARAGAENEHLENKARDGYAVQQDAEGEHEGEYTHTSASFGARRFSYNYNPNGALGPVHSDQHHVPPEMTHSPHQNGSGRATPRTAAPYAAYTSTPQRASHLPSSNLNYVMSTDARAGAQQNGTDPYAPQVAYQPPPQYPPITSLPPSTKRGREDDSEDPYGRPMSAGGDLKRQRTDSGAMRSMSQAQPVKAGGVRR